MEHQPLEPTQNNPQEFQIQNLLDCVDLDSSPIRKPTTGSILLGHFHGFDEEGRPLVIFDHSDKTCPAQTTVPLTQADVGRQVATMFLADPQTTLIVLGVVQNPDKPAEVRLDGERLVLAGKQEVELRCGKASILLKQDGKIIIKGTHIVSRSSGPNKVKGASISIN